MSLAILHSRALRGLDAPVVTVEVHLANGLPYFGLVGLADTEVKEARERVRAALVNSGLAFPHDKRITVSLAPADLPKDSGRFDLPIALGILAASGQLEPARLAAHEFAGELSLGGELRPVRGALVMALALQRDGVPRRLVLPPGSAEEAARLDDGPVWRADHLLDVVAAVARAEATLPPPLPGRRAPGLRPAEPAPAVAAPPGPDLREVRGQAGARRALEVAAAGGHSLLLVGPPGTGKSMLAQRLPGLLPPPSREEALASAAVWSLAGRFDPAQWGRRVLRAPHHGASAPALVGGGSPPRPGEISLAHAGVLFLDELPEFPRAALEALREPLESGRVTISRALHQAEFPARFQLVAAMNPCPCGHHGSPLRACRCPPDRVQRYQGRLSGPLLDRIDLQVEVPAIEAVVLAGLPAGEDSATVAARVATARQRQQARQGAPNATLEGGALDRHAAPTPDAQRFLQAAAGRLGWSARGYHRVLRIARTVADLAGAPAADVAHVAEAIQYRRVLAAG
ncbi:YifB family Mg chelatase-like AAA ATPase [Piscinibacter sakaiensis]|uniref:Mg(2+) chelatase family protein/ComM-related protein n=1 Tax=Piscinibacter sakaiensis TaxID=1547922 RepID=A0A0K8NZZ4_PISS1|nr:YifB family Mg chelatase-like AAA ATPase [Piscinibacter sakaiensis]GAP35948.1 Mg(2+) chelatase family protein/ComM-related protein [Piscinibacter sakaiensis]